MIEIHPLWADYRETLSIIREVRPEAEKGNENASERLEILEERLSNLAGQIGTDLEIFIT